MGFFIGIVHRLNSQPLASAVMKEEHREWATTARLNAGIAAYESLPKKDGSDGAFQVPWPQNLVLYYQTKFYGEDLVLNRAWQDIPAAAILLLLDTVRTRLLDFALELRGQIEDDDKSLAKVEPRKVDAAVTNIIYGGTNVVGSNITGAVTQIGDVGVTPGDFSSLKSALEALGVSTDDILSLKTAIEADKNAGDETGFGERTASWLATAAKYVGKGAGKIASGVTVATVTKAILIYLGLESLP